MFGLGITEILILGIACIVVMVAMIIGLIFLINRRNKAE